MAAEKEKDEKKDEKEGAEAPPKKSKKLLLIIIIAVVLIGGGAGGFLFLKGKKAVKAGEGEGDVAEARTEKSEHGGGHGDDKGGKPSTVMNLEPFIVNLQDNSGTRYLKLTINLELNSPSAQDEITKQAAQIRDALIILLSSKSYSDIGTVEGKYQMRDEIVSRINQFLTKGKVKTAYFTDFVVQ